MLQQNYEDLIPYLLKGEHIPISPVMLTQVANKLNNWDDHGTPILLQKPLFGRKEHRPSTRDIPYRVV